MIRSELSPIKVQLHHFSAAEETARDNPHASVIEMAEIQVSKITRHKDYPELRCRPALRQLRVGAWIAVFRAFLEGQLIPIQEYFIQDNKGLIRRKNEYDPVCQVCEHRLRPNGCRLDAKYMFPPVEAEKLNPELVSA